MVDDNAVDTADLATENARLREENAAVTAENARQRRAVQLVAVACAIIQMAVEMTGAPEVVVVRPGPS